MQRSKGRKKLGRFKKHILKMARSKMKQKEKIVKVA